MTIGKRFTFEAAHQLPNHDGKCARLHGHSYVVEVAVAGEQIPEGQGFPDEGMVIDFSLVSSTWRAAIFDRLDHRNLNDVLDVVTTAENLAVWILRELRHELERMRDVKVESVTVWETATSWARAE